MLKNQNKVNVAWRSQAKFTFIRIISTYVSAPVKADVYVLLEFVAIEIVYVHSYGLSDCELDRSPNTNLSPSALFSPWSSQTESE